MTTESDLQAMLDTNPDDWQTRLVLSDYLQEQGDSRAVGYRALGTLRLHPMQDLREARYRDHSSKRWFFWNIKDQRPILTFHAHMASLANRLPSDWHMLVVKRNSNTHDNHIWVGYDLSRQVVENKVALAFALLPPERQAELLSGC